MSEPDRMITRRTLLGGVSAAALLAPFDHALAFRLARFGGTAGSGPPAQTIASINLSPTTYTAGVANGVVGTVTVTMSNGNSPPPNNTPGLSITGANTGGFHLSGTSSGASLLQNSGGTTGVGPYNDFNIVYTQTGISNSPQQITPTLSGGSVITLSNSTFTAGSTSGTVVGAISVSPSAGPLSITGTNAADFQLSSTTLPSNLELNATLALGSYSITINAGAYSQPFTINGIAAGANEVTFFNDGGSTMPAGTPTQTFGWVFKDGDIPAGHIVTFTAGSTSQPYSAGLFKYWPSGALARATFMLLPTFSLGAGSSQVVTIADGGAGSWPTSTRTLAEIYSQGIVINAPTAGSSTYNGRSVNLGAWLNGDANTRTTVGGAPSIWLDGAAGRGWRIVTNMAQTAGAAADGQLVASHYVIGLTDGSGNFGGCRWLGAVRQPYYNNDTPAKRFVFFAPPNAGTPTAGTNWQSVGPGGSGTVTTPLQWIGNDGNPITAQTFTYGTQFTGSISGQILTVTDITTGGNFGVIQPGDTIAGTGITPNTFYINAFGSGGTTGTGGVGTYQLDASVGTVVLETMTSFQASGGPNQGYLYVPNNWGTASIWPVMITGSSLPPCTNAFPTAPFTNSGAFANGAFAFININEENNFSYGNLWYVSYTQGGFNYDINTGSGQGTLTPVPGLWSFNRLWFADKNARYHFIQGNGSLTSETMLRAQINQGYWQSTRLMMPQDLSYTSANVPSTTYNTEWVPYSIQYFNWDQGGTGDHTDIGHFPNIAAVDFYGQSLLDEISVRIVGLALGLQIFDFKDITTDTIVRLDNPSNPSYTGLPASSIATTIQWAGAASGSGFTIPPGGAGAIGFATSAPLHEPNYSGWAFLRTGELQYIEMMADQALGPMLINGPLYRNPTPGNSGVSPAQYGTNLYWGNGDGELRSIAWGSRDLQLAAYLYPWNAASPTSLDYQGTQTGKYLNDFADVDANFGMLQLNAGAAVYGSQNTYVQASSMWAPYNIDSNAGQPAYSNNGYNTFELGFVIMAQTIAYLRGNVLAGDFLEVMMNRCEYVRTHYAGSTTGGGAGSGNANGYYILYAGWLAAQFISGITGELGYPFVGADTQWGMEADTDNSPWYSGTPLNWRPNSPGTSAFYGSPGHSYVPTDGDWYIPDPAFGFTGNVPAPFQHLNTTYYVVNATSLGGGAYAFDLAASPGGSAIAVTDSGPTGYPNTTCFYMAPTAPPIVDWPYYSDWMLIFRAAMCWAYATNPSRFAAMLTVVSDVNYRLANTSGGPYNTLQPGESGGPEPIDARWALQPSFA